MKTAAGRHRRQPTWHLPWRPVDVFTIGETSYEQHSIVIVVGERRALVIASQCDSLNLLSFLPKAAHEVAAALLDPEIGGCVPATGTGTLIDPTMVELDDALVEAFERASEDEATLFLALVGHGDYSSDDFYFLTRDAQYPPDSRKSYLLAQRIKELLSRYSLLDGLVILLDTCHAGIAAVQAAERWSRIVGAAGKRFEVLTASDDRTAANGCFSLSLAKVLRSGDPELGERLRCPDLKRVISSHCPAQTAVHLAFDGTWVTAKGDQGLWLARNTSAEWQPLRGNPAAAEIERLTRDYRPPRQLGEVVGQVLGGARCVQINGQPAETSALVAALARPAVAGRSVPPDFLDAVLFARRGQTIEQLARELGRQLARSIHGFAEVSRPELSAFDRSVLEPLRALARDEPIRIAVDGITTLSSFDRHRLLDSLAELVRDPGLGWVQLVLTVDVTTQWPGVTSVHFPTMPVWQRPGQSNPAGPEAAEEAELVEDADEPDELEIPRPPTSFRPSQPRDTRGRWVRSRRTPLSLLKMWALKLKWRDWNKSSPFPSEKTSIEQEPVVLLYDLLRISRRYGPLPVAILLKASEIMGGPARLSLLRDELAKLGDEALRPQAGTPDEHVQLARDVYFATEQQSEILEVLLNAISTAAETDEPSRRYAIANEAELCWIADRPADAVRSLDSRQFAAPVENREHWSYWSARVAESAGEGDRLTIICRARHATWIGKSGAPAIAYEEFQQLLTTAEVELLPDDPAVFSIRNNFSYLLTDLGRFEEAREKFRVLAADARETLGASHVETIHARHLLSVAEGKCGNGQESLRQARELLPDAVRALGEDHELVTKIEGNIVFWSTEIDESPSSGPSTAARPRTSEIE